MAKGPIEFGLNDDPAEPVCRLTSFAGGLLRVVSETAVESDTLNTKDFRAKLDRYRRRLEASVDTDPNTTVVAADCLRLCQDYLVRARQYLLERGTEFGDVIEVMRVAISKLAGEAKGFNVRLKGSSERINRLTDIEDIRELKKRICQEVLELNRVVVQKQKQDELNYARLSNRVRVLQANLTHYEQEAAIDSLTCIANRRRFDRTLAEWLEEHKHSQKPFILAFLDLHDFKKINDTHGHQVGDRVLFCAAEWFNRFVESKDFLARYGGEEFVVMLEDVDTSQAELKFAELLSSMSNCNYTYQKDDCTCNVAFTASCGVAAFTLEESGEDLLRRADEALSTAKKTGKNRVVVAKPPQSLWKTLISRGMPRSVKQDP